MPPISTLLLFVAASYALSVLPGPAVLYIVNRSIGHGRKAGVYSALGIAVGGSVHVLAAALGISTLLASSAVAFSLVKYAGGVYLIYLGVKALRSSDLMVMTGLSTVSNRQAFGQGVVVNTLNPKTALFFLSFFPQFIDRSAASITGQMLVLGAVFLLASLSSDLVYAMGGATIGRILETRRGVRRAHRYVSGGVLIGLGVTVSLSE